MQSTNLRTAAEGNHRKQSENVEEKEERKIMQGKKSTRTNVSDFLDVSSMYTFSHTFCISYGWLICIWCYRNASKHRSII